MNHLKLLFALSVALNFGFITLLVLQIASSPRPSGARPEQGHSPHLPAETHLAGEAPEATGDPSDAAPATAQAYRRLFSALRATALPEEEIRRILRGTAMADWQDDIERVQGETELPEEFWRIAPADQELEIRRQVQELRTAREAALAELLGDADAIHLTADSGAERTWPALPPEQRRKVRMLEEDYALLFAEIHARSNGVYLPEDREALRLLHEARQEDLGSLLSPAALEEYEFRHSEISRRLRQELRFFDATEEEFRDLVRLHQELALTLPLEANVQPQQPAAAGDPAGAAVRDLLGESRFADFQRATDPDFQQLAAVSGRLNLPLDRASRIYEYKLLAQEQYHGLREDPDLAPEEHREAVRLLADEAREFVRENLGETGYRAYLENGAEWLHRLDQLAEGPPSMTREP